ncbi:general secretion pathway protein GspB [Alteromonas sp. 1_MG-2023]|uniref:general secretion pathway protein GspB n=1 Tax=Alteromonas sp. 1_MG-2023 TaxID=3062669 RepID=UPI0026E42DC9|nr:general secretion pathway protein GspB [Alteromonas sp. 1_MG-2023]MDO6565516.1 general secretion pathway protein GspB [Alteromonas sp. 1_MG-2023]
MSNILSISDLKPGMVIVKITQQNGPVKIRKSGLVSSDAMVEGLAEMGVQEIEIDPDQTVEIAPATTAGTGHRTQTQALLRGQHDTSAKFDKTLSDQFNRSLFLPTVQGLPSMWKVYGKELATYTIIVTGGLCLGFMVATRGEWWPSVTASVVASIQSEKSTTADGAEMALQTPSSEYLPEPSKEALQGPSEPSTKPGSTDSSASPNQVSPNSNQPQQGSTGNDELASNSAPAQVADPSLFIQEGPGQESTHYASSPSQQLSQQNGQPNSQQSSGTESNEPNNEVDLAAAEEEGRVLNSQGDQDDNSIEVSPELLARFNQAVAALDTQAENDSFEPETKVTVRDNIQRVDQLPVRLLTRLPSMSFSAHMYASRPDDRWVRVNGIQMGEGDWIDDKVQIVNIEAQQVVLGFEEELFTMAALTDW